MTSLRRARGAWLGTCCAVLVVLGGLVVSSARPCTTACEPVMAANDVSEAQPAPVPPPTPAALAMMPRPASTDVNPAAPVLITATSGKLTGVTMVNDAGTTIPGVLTPDRTAWKPVDQLGYGRTYEMTVLAQGPGGMPSRQSASFTTVSPEDQAQVYFETVAGGLMQEGATYGVGTVLVAKFDEEIKNRANAERNLVVTTSPPVSGSWYWVDDQTAHWRPEKYYAPGTTVSATAKIYGVPLADGVYGAEDEKVSFKIGDAHVSIADDTTKQVSVFENGKLVRTMPTSMGMGGTETVGGTTFSFWTPPGVYTVLDKANPVIMDSSTFGLPTSSSLGYRTTVPYATRISQDGIYLHQLNATVWAQGNTNLSHGCLNLNSENAKWFYDFSVPGDVVEIKNTGGAPQMLSQNGDWSVPWSQWRAGSSLS